MVESVSGKKYDTFFDQWFYQSGHPVLSSNWKAKGHTLEISISQKQEQHIFQFPLELAILSKKGETVKVSLEITAPEQSFAIKLPFKAGKVTLDPDTWLLFESY